MTPAEQEANDKADLEKEDKTENEADVEDPNAYAEDLDHGEDEKHMGSE